MIWLLLLSCSSPERGGAECNGEKLCGWGETCINGYCEQGTCATSAQCPIEQWCDAGTCVEGCRNDDDCPVGNRCDVADRSCQPLACQDTQIDCGFREYCDTTTGECFDAGEQFCRPCERDDQCGEGNLCFADFCGVDCNDRACPSGFDCIPFRDDLGNIQTYQCITYCWLYETP